MYTPLSPSQFSHRPGGVRLAGAGAPRLQTPVDPPPGPGRRDSRGGQGAEPVLGNLLLGGGGGPHGPSRLLPFIREALTAAASAVSTRGLGSAAAWDAQSGAECVCLWGGVRRGVRWRARRGHRCGAHRAWSRAGAGCAGSRRGRARWGPSGLCPSGGAGLGACGGSGAPRHRGAPCAVGWGGGRVSGGPGAGQASYCQVGRDSGVASRIWGRPPAPLLPRAHLRGKAPSSSESFFPGFLLGNRSADPSLGPAVALELSESPGF